MRPNHKNNLIDFDLFYYIPVHILQNNNIIIHPKLFYMVSVPFDCSHAPISDRFHFSSQVVLFLARKEQTFKYIQNYNLFCILQQQNYPLPTPPPLPTKGNFNIAMNTLLTFCKYASCQQI